MQNSVGKPLVRVDGRAKVTGRATYTAEHQVPNAAYAVMVPSAIAKGRIAAIDTRAAERQPGVLAVLTSRNTPKLPPAPKGSSPSDRKLQLLQDDVILYGGQPVAVVVAETLEAAHEGARLVDVRYTPQRPLVEFGASPPTVKPEPGAHGEKPDDSRGDITAGLASAELKTDRVYITPFQVHNPMEPHATIAIWDGPDKLLLYDATQGPDADRQRFADLLGLHPDNIRVECPFLGGGFGSKGPTWSNQVLAAIAARHVQRPVKLVMGREQMFGPVGLRAHTRQTIAAGARRDGTLTALRHSVEAETSSFDEFLESAALPSRMLYATPNEATEQRLVRADIGTPSFMRAPGWAAGTNTLEIAMDEMAYELKMDPVAFRLKNYAAQDPEKSLPWSSKSLRECYRLGADRFGWSRRTIEPRSMRQGDTLIGWGMASAVYPYHRSKAGAHAQIAADGSILVESATEDIGTGTYTVMTQIAADALGVPPAQVTFRLGDTAMAESPVAAGSQTAASVGNAVASAGRALRAKIAQAAGAAPADIQIRGDQVAVGGKSQRLADLIAQRGADFFHADSEAQPGQEQKEYSMYVFGAHFAEVRVDAALGQLRVSRMVGAFGAGKILNPRTARNQFVGGMVWGISFALYENAVMDPHLGRFVNHDLSEYLVPVNADIGDVEAVWVDEVDRHVNPLGVKGIGEIGICGSAAAVANAVFHATGRRIREYPITLDKLI